MIFDVLLSDRLDIKIDRLDNVQFPMLGEHNVQNCLAAISICLEMAIDRKLFFPVYAIQRGGRRFDFKGETDGITIIDDYGHHPVEIRAALSAGRMRAEQNKLIAVVQPHRYSRLRDLFPIFVPVLTTQIMWLLLMYMPQAKTRLKGLKKRFSQRVARLGTSFDSCSV